MKDVDSSLICHYHDPDDEYCTYFGHNCHLGIDDYESCAIYVRCGYDNE